jgi:hypothetical protein
MIGKDRTVQIRTLASSNNPFFRPMLVFFRNKDKELSLDCEIVLLHDTSEQFSDISTHSKSFAWEEEFAVRVA